jgi:hypothetical protein
MVETVGNSSGEQPWAHVATCEQRTDGQDSVKSNGHSLTASNLDDIIKEVTKLSN